MLNMIILVFMVIYIRICKSKVTLTTISQDLAKNIGAMKIIIIVPGASYGQAYAGSYDATASNYAVNKRSARSLPQVTSSGFAQTHTQMGSEVVWMFDWFYSGLLVKNTEQLTWHARLLTPLNCLHSVVWF